MVKNLLRAFLVFRLEFHQPTLNFEAMLSYWRRAPIVQYVIEDDGEQYVIEDDGEQRSTALKRRLDEVYPF